MPCIAKSAISLLIGNKIANNETRPKGIAKNVKRLTSRLSKKTVFASRYRSTTSGSACEGGCARGSGRHRRRKRKKKLSIRPRRAETTTRIVISTGKKLTIKERSKMSGWLRMDGIKKKT